MTDVWDGKRWRRPRWKVALFLLALPVWLVPALLYVGWREGGRYVVRDIPSALKWVLMGK